MYILPYCVALNSEVQGLDLFHSTVAEHKFCASLSASVLHCYVQSMLHCSQFVDVHYRHC